MRPCLSLAAASLACLALVTSLASADWLLDFAANGSMEDDVNRDGAPDAWSPSAYDSPAKLAWDRAVAHTGVASVSIADSKGAEGGDWKAHSGRWYSRDQRPATPGKTYSLRAWIKTDLTEGTASVTISWSSGGSWLSEATSERLTGTADWRQVTVTAEAPDRADTCRIFCALYGGAGTAWFDDVSMVEGSEFPADHRPVDLRAVCTMGFADEVAGDGKGGWTDQGPNDARGMPLGRQTWRGVPFDIVDPGANNGRSCIVLKGQGRPNAPETVEVPLGLTCDTLYFAHACAWAGPKGRVVGRYLMRYADGQETQVELRNGAEIVDWWHPYDTKQSGVAWEGANAESESIGLNVFPWTNPRPETQITSVTFASSSGAVPILVAITAADGPPVLTERPVRLEFTDTTGWYEWAFALDDPTLEEIDVSFLLDPPAGKHGFLTVADDGHFVFEDGTPARFFGTNVGGSGCCPERETARIVARRLARFGCNMLRLHAADSRWGGLIDYERGDSRHLNPEALDRYDYFVAQLKEQGIYVYFDLFDYRSFTVADGIEHADEFDRNWHHCPKGASSYDRTLIELQKEFATQLLTHENPYTGNRYVDEPALAVQEITNENSVFYFANTDLTLPRYMDQLRERWNAWLVDRYGDRAGLAKAWTNAQRVCALAADEDPAKGNVELPLKHLYADLREEPYDGPRSPARLNAMTRFLYEVQRDHFQEMSDHLRGIGLRCPITGTNQDFSDASNFANAVCDFTSRNNYWQHPNVRAKPFMRFANSAAVRSDIVSTANTVANVCSSTVAGKPMISPEFNAPWPNEYRAECLPLMAAYGRLQGWDGLLYFAYGRGDPALSCFGNQTDPVRWGQVPAAALIFLRGDISEAQTTVHIGNSLVDCFATRPRRASDRYSPYRVLPYISKVRNAYFDEVYEGDADVVMSSGHSSSGDYSRARHAIVFADWPYTDELAKNRDRAASSPVPGLLGPGTAVHNTSPMRLPWDGRLVELTPDTVGRDGRLFGVPSPFPGAEDGRFLGVFLGLKYAIPHATALEDADPAWLHRLYLIAAKRWQLPGASPTDEAGKVFRSDTGELVLDREVGLFTINAPNVRAAVGYLADAGKVELGEVSIECSTPFASVILTSLDGRPVGESRRLLLTGVAGAENTGQAFSPGRTGIPERGRAPVLAQPVDCTVTLRIPPGETLRAYPLSPTGVKRDELATLYQGRALTVILADAHSPWILLEPTDR